MSNESDSIPLIHGHSRRPRPLGPAEWHARVAERVATSLPPLTAEHSVLVAEAREGLTALCVANHLPVLRRMIVAEGDRDALNRARGVFDGSDGPPVFFSNQSLPSLQFADGVFDAAVCVAGVVTTAQLLNAVSELSRLVRPGGNVVVAALGGHAFGLLEEIAREAAWSAHLDGTIAEDDSDEIDAARVTPHSFDEVAAAVNATIVERGSLREHVSFGRGPSVLGDATVARDLFGAWRVMLPNAAHALDRLPSWLDAWFADRELVDDVEVLWARFEVQPEPEVAVRDEDVVAESAVEDEEIELLDDDVIDSDTPPHH